MMPVRSLSRFIFAFGASQKTGDPLSKLRRGALGSLEAIRSLR